MMSLVAKRFDDAKAGKPVRLFKSHRDGHRRRRAEARFHLCRRRGGGGALAAGNAAGLRHLQCRHRQGAQLPRSDHGDVRALGREPEHRIRRHAGRRSGTSTSISRKPRSTICGAPATTPASRRWKSRCAATSRSSSTAPTGTAECWISRNVSRASRQQTILCVGDLMLDDFVYGEVARISPEAPAPVIAVKRNEVDDRRRRQRGAQHRHARRALHLRRRDRRRRCRRARRHCTAASRAAHRALIGGRSHASDDPQGALRLRALFHASVARRLGARRAGRAPSSRAS